MIPLLAALLLLAPQTDTNRLSWVPDPRRSTGSWVADPGGHLSAATVDRINAIASVLERATTAEIAVAVLDSLDGLEPSSAALLLHRRWGVGKANRDNGIVLLWAPGLRQIYVSVGYGLEGVLPDARTGRIQREAMIPAFRRNEFEAGMIAGVEALASAAREETYAGMARNQAARPARDMSGDGAFPWWVAFPVVGFLGLGVGGSVGWRYRPRRCRNGHGWMRRLGEAEDDAFIGAEGALEERLGSMNYDVWVCPSCDDRRVSPHRKIFSRYGECPSCKRRTLETIKKTLIAATYSHGGEREVTRTCRNSGCGYKNVTREAIPRLQASSSSSGGGGSGGGGGGSSFGGGSSGGGGAGSSY